MRINLRKHFPIPAFLQRPSIGISISDTAITYCSFAYKAQPSAVKHFGKIEVPPGVIEKGEVVDKEKLLELLTPLRKKAHTHFARFSIPEEKVYLFRTQTSVAKPSDVRDTIELQLEEHVPVPGSELIFDYDVLGVNKKDEYNLQVAAVTRRTVQTYLDVFKKADFTVLGIEPETHAVARAIVPQDNQEVVMLVARLASSVVLVVAQSGIAFYTSTITDQGKTEEEGEKNDKEEGVKLPLEHIEKHFNYWNTHITEQSQAAGKKITRIITSGHFSHNSKLFEEFSERIDVPIVQANAWENVSLAKEDESKVKTSNIFEYVTAIGLALADFFHD